MALLARILALLVVTMATVAIKLVPLDMVQDSFNDQYQGCGPAMTKALPALYKFEFQKNPLFAKTWVKAKAEWRKRGSHVSPLVSPAQAVAVMAYTMKHLYKEFNAAVHVAGCSRQEYQNNFHFKMLHFLLTQALVTLRQAQNGQCHQVYRGVRDVRFQAQQGQRVRFGQFTSTSPSKEVAQHYGTDTILQVHTPLPIRNFFGKMLPIPPFETFEVTDVNREGSIHIPGRASCHILHFWGTLKAGIWEVQEGKGRSCPWGGTVPVPSWLVGLLERIWRRICGAGG
uniref:NAD(P)(+)--arginine ADP-ribosyltransferase n=1 Tax=Junco hyemalis TaxID=40217 RepID=A0A8C5NN52_JUNHY